MKQTHTKFIFAAIMLLSMLTFKLGAQLNGVFTINSAVVTGGTNYQTWNAFATAINTGGVNGPVTVNVVAGSGPYAEQVNFGVIAGTSATNTITINGNSTTLTFAATALANPHTLRLGGADYMTFNNLNVVGTGGTYAMVCHLWNSSDNNTFNSCTFTAPLNSTGVRQTAVTMSGANNSATSLGPCGNNNTWNACTMSGGVRAVSFYGSTGSPYNTGNAVIDCNLRDFYQYGVYNYYCQNTVIRGNTIERTARTTVTSAYGVFLNSNSFPTMVENNRIRRFFDAVPGSGSTTYGIYLVTSATSSSVNVIRNNVISDMTSSGTIYGIYEGGYTFNNIYHNTIALDDINATTGSTTYGIIAYGSPNVKNNVITIRRGGPGTKYCLNYNSSGIVSDYNVLYMNAAAGTTGLGYSNGTGYSTLANWQSAGNSWDIASKSGDPAYTNPGANNYAPTTATLNNTGQPLGVAFDITGFGRNLPAPDAGAFEFFNVNCTTTPPTNTVSAPAGIVCPSAQNFLAMNNTYTVNGLTYAWVSSTVSAFGPFTAIPGATMASFVTPTLTSNIWYTAIVGCINGGPTMTATAGQIQIAGTQIDNVPYYEGFENNSSANNLLPNCSWSRSSMPNCKTTAVSNTANRVPNSGNGYAYFDYGGQYTQNNYRFHSNGIQLNAGVTYSAWVNYISPGWSAFSDISLKYGPNQSAAGLITLASASNPQNSSYAVISNTFQVGTSGVYYLAVTATDNSGGSYITFDDLGIIAPCEFPNNAAPVVLNAPSVICMNQTVSLSASGAGTYSWNTGSTAPSIQVSPVNSTTYTVVGTNILSNCKTAVQVPILVNPIPSIQIYATSSSICEGKSTVLSAFGSATSFTWSTGPMTSQIVVSPNTSTTYSVVGSNSFGCQITSGVYVNVNPSPAISVSGNTNVCLGEASTMTGSGADTYTWSSPGVYLQSNPVSVFPGVSANYTVTGADANGCVGGIVVSLMVNACTGIANVAGAIEGLQVYPNPNNGEFTVELNNGLSKTIEVFDITGRNIVSSTSSSNEIKMNIGTLSNGVYYVKVKSDNAVEVLKIVKQ